MPKKIRVNGREYSWPIRPTVVVCVDGCEPDYIEQALDAGAMPFTAEMQKRGVNLLADGVVPSFTNPNNLSIVTGVAPAVHGICGNYFLDPTTGSAVMMNDPSYLRCHTILAAFAAAGARVAVVSAKDKLRSLLGHALPLANGNSVCFSAEKADEADLQKNGIEEALALVGKPLPPVYSAELSEFVFAAGVQLIKSDHWDLLYLSSTDFIQHQFAPGTPAANSFYSMLDGYLSQLDALGVTLAITADHGMKPKHDAEGRPNVIYLQQMLDEWLGGGKAKVILPITDPYVVHHGALGSFALIYLASERDADRIGERLAGTEGILEVLSRQEGCARFGLPPDREGDLIVISTADQTLGTRPEHHDLGKLKTPLRSHGGTTEQRVPMLLNRPCQRIDSSVKLRNFDAFSLALNSF